MTLKEQDKMFEKFECPHCGASLLEKGIRFSQIVKNIYNPVINEEGEIEYKLVFFIEEAPPKWYCMHCGEDLPLLQEEGEELFRRIQRERDEEDGTITTI